MLPVCESIVPHLASKEGECIASRLKELKHSSDEGSITVLFQVGLEADKRALLLGSHMHCEVGVILGEGEGEKGRVITISEWERRGER